VLFLELVSTGSPYGSALFLYKQVSVVAVLRGDRSETGTLIALQEEYSLCLWFRDLVRRRSL